MFLSGFVSFIYCLLTGSLRKLRTCFDDIFREVETGLWNSLDFGGHPTCKSFFLCLLMFSVLLL